MSKSVKPDPPKVTIWGCVNNHYYTREDGNQCPKCGCDLQYPQSDMVEVNTRPVQIKPPQTLISDGAVPQTTRSTLEVVRNPPPLGIAVAPPRKGHGRGQAQPEQVPRNDDHQQGTLDEPASHGLTKCEFGHFHSKLSSFCYFCENLDKLEGGRGQQERVFVRSENPEPSEPNPVHFNPFRMPELEFVPTGWCVGAVKNGRPTQLNFGPPRPRGRGHQSKGQPEGGNRGKETRRHDDPV